MQDFDALRHRVEETAERLSSAQSERQREIQSLIAILGDLEEKYSAQEKQFAYYRSRLEPLERSNAQLTSLIENLLDLIDRGFGENSLEPLRKASGMASVLLERDLPPVDAADAPAETAPQPQSRDVPEPVGAEPEMATLDDVQMDAGEDTAQSAEGDPPEVAGGQNDKSDEPQIIQDLMELMDNPEPASDGQDRASQEEYADAAGWDDPDDDDDEVVDGVSDLELEEVPLSKLEDDIDMALDDYAVDLETVASSGLAGLEDNSAASGDNAAAKTWDPSARFDDVSDAVLKLELEEDAANATDDLPDVVKTAAAAFASDSTADEVDTLAAIAEAMEKETQSGQAPPPPHSDIRSLMLRVEALAKKAEAMRMAQTDAASGASGASAADDDAATANKKPNNPDVAA